MSDTNAKRVAIYARVSTGEQQVDSQLLELRRYASERGWTIQDEYVDVGISGSKQSRPNLDRLMDAARKRKLDVVLVFRFDRFARSVKHLILALEEFKGLGIGFVSYCENIDTQSALGAALFVIVGAIAELEKNIIVERVKSGMNRARSQGSHIGRPYAKIDAARVLKLRADGLSTRRISQQLGVPRSTIHDFLKSNRAQTGISEIPSESNSAGDK